MARSLKKGPYVHYSLEKKIQQTVSSGKKSVIKTWSRASMITKHGWSQARRIFSNKII